MGENYYYNLRSKKTLENPLNITFVNNSPVDHDSSNDTTIAPNLNTNSLENNNLSVEEIEELETSNIIHSIVDSIFDDFINDVQSFKLDKTNNSSSNQDKSKFSETNTLNLNKINVNSSENIEASFETMAFDKKWAFKVIPEFTGEDSKLVNKFISCCDVIYEPLTTKEEQTEFLKFLATKLDKEAFDLLHYNKFESWKDLKKEIQKRFGETRSVYCIQNEIRNAHQGQSDNIVKFGHLIENLLLDLNNACLVNDGEEAAIHFLKYNKQLAIQSFENGLRDSRISLLVKACRFSNIKDAVAKAVEEEQILQLKSKSSLNNPIKCQNCDKVGHTSRTCRVNLNQPRQNFQGGSYNGFKPHSNSNNSNNSSQNNSNPSQNRSINSKSIRNFRVFCNYCRKYGHSISECYRANRYSDSNCHDENLGTTNNSENLNSENLEGLDLTQSMSPGTSSRVQDV